MPYYPRRHVKKNLLIGLFLIAAPVALFFLINEGKNLTQLKVAPLDLPYTVVHIDLKGSPPKISYLESLLPLLKEYGANGLLMEYEDMFPYTNELKAVRASNAYSPEELTRFLTTAATLGFQIIPIVQTFGHLEYVLKLAQFRHLREKDEFPDSICPSNSESQALIAEMLKQVIMFHKNIAPIEYFHIGCDEVYHMNSCTKCKMRRVSNIGIYINQVKFIKDTVQKLIPNTKVLIWDDMMRDNDEDKMKSMGLNNVEPVYWDYTPNLRVYFNLMKYQRAFDRVWVASAYKGADGRAATLPDFERRFDNHLGWLKILSQLTTYNSKYTFKGIILTGWSRYSHMDAPCETLQASLHSLVLNLLLVQKFKEGFCLRIHEKHSMDYFASKYDSNLNCNNVEPYSNNFALRCDSKKLIKLFANLENVRSEVIKYIYGNNYGLYTLEYYGQNYINLNIAQEVINWCVKTKGFIKDFEDTAKKIMSKAYEQEFIDEYLHLKLYDVVKRVNIILNITKTYQQRRTWPPSKPIIQDLEKLRYTFDEKDDLKGNNVINLDL